MSDVLISRLANARAIAAERLPAIDVLSIDDAIAAIAEIARTRSELAWFRSRVRNIYRPGHPRTEWCIDGQRVGWGVTLDDALDEALGA